MTNECIDRRPHDFIPRNPQPETTSKESFQAWCRGCGALLDVYAHTSATIILPVVIDSTK